MGYTRSEVHTKWGVRYTRKSGVHTDWDTYGVEYIRSEVYTKWGSEVHTEESGTHGLGYTWSEVHTG